MGMVKVGVSSIRLWLENILLPSKCWPWLDEQREFEHELIIQNMATQVIST